APLVHLLLRSGPTRMRGVVLAGWVASFLPFGVASPLTAALAGVAVLALLRGTLRATAGARQALFAAAAATGVLTVVWSIAAADLGSERLLLAIGDLVVVGAIGIALASAGGAWTREAGRALVIELGPARRPGLPLTSRLARALADPELEVRYDVPGVG